MTPPGGPPAEVAKGAALSLGSPEAPDPIVSYARIGGGCIHPAARVRTRSGTEAFLKWSPDPGWAGFGVEARGLEALRERGGVRVPRVLGWHDGDPEARGWLLLELVREGSATPETPEQLGRGLARLHRPEEGWSPGWDEEGALAGLVQPNPEGLEWPAFWVEARLLPHWRRVRRAFPSEVRAAFDLVAQEMDRILEGYRAHGTSLLHGDLWSGNVLTDEEGGPVLIDPAVYRGHREVDLAMMELFGGFSGRVFEAYEESAPPLDGYRERRRDAYQLHPLLVHVELFGAGYVGRTSATIRRLARR